MIIIILIASTHTKITYFKLIVNKNSYLSCLYLYFWKPCLLLLLLAFAYQGNFPRAMHAFFLIEVILNLNPFTEFVLLFFIFYLFVNLETWFPYHSLHTMNTEDNNKPNLISIISAIAENAKNRSEII